MQTNFFKTFGEVNNYIEGAIKNIKMTQRDMLRAIGKHLRFKIKNAHGKKGQGWAKNYSSPNSPLLKTGKLRGAVSFKTTANSVEVFSTEEWLAVIHEYGVTYKMTDKQRKFLFATVFKDQKSRGRPKKNWGTGMVTIPARPIWRRVIKREESRIYKIAEDNYGNIFK